MTDPKSSGESSGLKTDDISIVVLAPSFEAFGMAIDFLSRTDPFGAYEVDALSNAVLNQLNSGHNLAAIRNGKLIGYAGWLLTTEALGDEWTGGRAILRPMAAETANAAALTIVASGDRSATTRLIRGAREMNKGVRVFFKRGYDGTVRESRKNSVLNFSNN